MSKLLNFSSSGNIGPPSGARLASVVLTPAAANSTLSLSDSTGALLTLAAGANGSSSTWQSGDSDDGAHCEGQVTATLTGAGATYSVELK